MLKLRVKQVIYQSRYNDNIKRPRPQDAQLEILRIYASCRKIQKRVSGPGVRCWRYVVHVFENTPKSLVVQGRAQLEHSSHIVKVGVEVTCFHFNPWRILNETTEPGGLFGTVPQKSWHPGKSAKLDDVIQLNSGEVRTHASHETTRTWENFNKRGTKMALLSGELWLIANNSKIFANENKSIVNTLGLCKHFQIYLF